MYTSVTACAHVPTPHAQFCTHKVEDNSFRPINMCLVHTTPVHPLAGKQLQGTEQMPRSPAQLLLKEAESRPFFFWLIADLCKTVTESPCRPLIIL